MRIGTTVGRPEASSWRFDLRSFRLICVPAFSDGPDRFDKDYQDTAETDELGIVF
jgi:hypothetical protein